MENLQQRIKELGKDLNCEKFCRPIYQIKERCKFLSIKQEESNKLIKGGISYFNISQEKRRKKIFREYGPTPQECMNFNCVVPFIVREFGNHHELDEYLVQQEGAVDDFKWYRGIENIETAWRIWTSEKGDDGLTHAEIFSIEYFKKHPHSTLNKQD